MTPHLSEVLKLIQHGVAGNANMVRDYALLLADKLAVEGLVTDADAVRKKAYGVPPAPEESASVPEQPVAPRRAAEETATARTHAIVQARVDLALSTPHRLELADHETGVPMAGDRRRALFIRGFHEIAAGMGVDRFAETPVTVLTGFMVMSILKNHDTRGLLKSLVNSFLSTYSMPETADEAFQALVGLEGLRAKLAHARQMPSAHAGLRAAADSLTASLKEQMPWHSAGRPAFKVLVGADRLYIMAPKPFDNMPTEHAGFPVEFMAGELTGTAYGQTTH